MARAKLEPVTLVRHGNQEGACPASGTKIRTQIKSEPHPRIEGKTWHRGWCKACRSWVSIEE